MNVAVEDDKDMPSFAVLASLTNNNNRIHSLDFSFTGNNNAKLRNCHGCSKPQTMLAVLGPCKQAQTALLHVLAGRQSALKQLTSGTFTANDNSNLFKLVRAAHVEAIPRHFSTSTVEEDFAFACALRNPSSAQVHEDLIHDLLVSLNLLPQAKKQIRRLTKSQLKRHAIGIELLSLPNLLLVDQPLTEQDRKEDWETMQLLQTLAMRGICQVVVTLSSPLPEIFHMVSTHFMLLGSNGETMSCGSTQHALDSVVTNRKLGENLEDVDFLLLCCAQQQQKQAVASGKFTLQCALTPPTCTTTWKQLKLLFVRELLDVKRMWALWLALYVAVALLFAIIAVAFEGCAEQTVTYLYNVHFGSFVFPILILGLFTSVPLSINMHTSKLLILREHRGAYSVAPALACKFIFEFTLNFILICVGIAIVHAGTRWNTSYILLVCTFFLMAESCCSYAYVFAMWCSTASKAAIFTFLILGVQLLFFGAAPTFSFMPVWAGWLHYICNFSWTVKLIFSQEMSLALCQSPTVCATWQYLLNADYIDRDPWTYYVILVAFTVFWRALGIAGLYRKIQ